MARKTIEELKNERAKNTAQKVNTTESNILRKKGPDRISVDELKKQRNMGSTQQVLARNAMNSVDYALKKAYSGVKESLNYAELNKPEYNNTNSFGISEDAYNKIYSDEENKRKSNSISVNSGKESIANAAIGSTAKNFDMTSLSDSDLKKEINENNDKIRKKSNAMQFMGIGREQYDYLKNKYDYVNNIDKEGTEALEENGTLTIEKTRRKTQNYYKRLENTYNKLDDTQIDAVKNLKKAEANHFDEQVKDNYAILRSAGLTDDEISDVVDYQTHLDNVESTNAYREGKNQQMQDAGWDAQAKGALNSAASFGYNVLSPLDALEQARVSIHNAVSGDEDYIPYDTSSALFSNRRNALRESVVNKIDSSVDNDAVNSALKFAYNTGMSMGDSAIALTTGNETETLALMSAQAGTQSYIDSTDRGLDTNHAALTALAAGGAEAITEKISLDSLFGKINAAKAGKTGAKQTVKNVLQQAFVEGSEEVNSDVLNLMTDSIINGDQSEYEQTVRNYVKNGMSEQDARSQAGNEWISNAVQDFAAGGISGGVFAGAGTAYGSSQYKKLGTHVNTNENLKESVFEAAKQMDDNTTAKQLVLNKKVENVTDSDMSNILQSMSEVAGKDMHTVLTERFQELGEQEQQAKTDATEVLNAVSTDSADVSEEENNARTSKFAQNDNLGTVYTEALKGKESVAQRALQTASMSYQAEKTLQREENTGKRSQTGVARAIDKTTGKQAIVIDVAEVAPHKTIVRMSDGRYVDLGSIEIQDYAKQRLYNFAGTMESTKAANALIENYNGETLPLYVNATAVFFNAGKLGASSFDEMMNNPKNASLVSVVSSATLNEMYSLGQNYAKESNRVEKYKNATSRQAINENIKKGTGQVIDRRTDKADTRITEVAKVVAKKMGIDITMDDNLFNGENGHFAKAMSRIALSSESNNEYATLVHEINEFADSYNPEGMKKVMDTVLNYAATKEGAEYLTKRVGKYQDAYKRVETGKKYEDAAGEFVFDYLAGVFSTEDGVNAFTTYMTDSDMSVKEQKSILQTIADFFKGIIDRINSYLSDHTLSATAERGLQADADKAAEIRSMVLDAWEQARVNYESGENAVEGEKFSIEVEKYLTSYSEHQLENWKGSNKIIVYENEEQLYKFIEDAKNNINLGKKLYFGMISEYSVEKVMSELGIDIENHNCSISAQEVKKIFRSHGDKKAEELRGQEAVTEEDFEDIPKIIGHPDSVALNGEYQGRPVIVFKNGNKSIAGVVSKKHLEVFVQTMYKGKKNRSLATAIDEQASIDTSKTTSSTASKESIPSNTSIVNSREKYSIDIDEDFFNLLEKYSEDEQKTASIIQEGFEALSKVDVSDKMIHRMAYQIRKDYKSTYDLGELESNLKKVFAYLKNTPDVAYTDMVRIVQEVAKPVIEQSMEVNQAEKVDYDKFRGYLKNTKIRLTSAQKQEVSSMYDGYNNFRKKNFGTLTLSEDGIYLDELWEEMCEQSNGRIEYDVNEGDMPSVLMETLNAMKPSKRNIYGMDTGAAAYDLALDIYRRFFVEQAEDNANKRVAKKTQQIIAAQQELRRRSVEGYKQKIEVEKKRLKEMQELNIKRLAQNIKELTEEQRQALQDNDLITQATLEREKNVYKYRMELLRKQNNKNISELKARNRQSRENTYRGRMNTQLKAKVRRNVDELNKLLKHPTESQHIPVEMVHSVIDVLNAVNVDTGKSAIMKNKLDNLQKLYSEYLGKDKERVDYDEHTQNMITRLQNMFEGRNYTELTNTELLDVLNMVKAVRTQIRNANKLLEVQGNKDAYHAAESIIEEISNTKGVNHTFTRNLDRYTSMHLNAKREFRKLSGYLDDSVLMKMYDNLDEGQRKEMQVQREINDIFKPVLEGKQNQKEVKKLRSTKKEDLVDIGLRDNGKPVMVTREMRLSVIMHSMNHANMNHVLNDGFSIPDLKLYAEGKYKDAYAQGKTYRYVNYMEMLTALKNDDQSKIDEIVSAQENSIKKLRKQLSPYEESFLQCSMKMFHEYTGDVINETSVKTRGYAVARTGNYFPIKTDGSFTKKDFAGLVRDASIEGMGMLKERVVSKNPILLEGITEVIMRQTDSVSRYAGYAIPVRNMNKVLNVTYRDENGNLRSVKDTIAKKWGTSNLKYMEDLMKDIQGARRQESNIFDTLRSKFAGATLTLNPSVAIKQAASYPTAAAKLGYGPLTKAMKDISKGFKGKGIEELESINPMLWYRNQGNSTQELGDIRESKDFGSNLPKLLNWIQGMDTATVRTLEYASMYYVDDNFKQIQKGTNEYWEKVSQVFTDVVEETQPNYSVMQQAQILRDPNKLLKQIVMFKTQPMQNFGIMYDALGEMNAYGSRYKSEMTVESKARYTKAKKNFVRAVTSQTLAAAVFSAMTIFARALMHNFKPYKDDDDNKFSWNKVLKEFEKGIISCMSGSLIGGSDLYNYLYAKVTGDTYYGIDVSILETMNDLKEATLNIDKYTKKYAESITEEDKQKNKYRLLHNINIVAAKLGEMFAGVPVNNIENILKSPYLYIKGAIDGDVIGIEMPAADNVDSQYTKIQDAWLDGDDERADELIDQQVEKLNKGKEEPEADEKTVMGTVKSKMNKNMQKGDITEDEVKDILKEEYGMSEDDMYFQFRKWNGINTYDTFKSAIDKAYKSGSLNDRDAIFNEIAVLKSHGIEEQLIKTNVTKLYKGKYLELKKKRNEADLKNLLLSVYMNLGDTRKEAMKKIDAWKEKEEEK